MSGLEKEFNITGTCVPKKHYMVDLTRRLREIKKLVDKEKYLSISRGRQFGKTTVLSGLRRFLADEYIVISISFEGMGETAFESEKEFCKAFLMRIYDKLLFSNVADDFREGWNNKTVSSFNDLSRLITKMCENNKIVLLIDEVDKASNHIIFLNFLSKLRDKYLSRADEQDYTFHSVILASVYDIKNLKFKMVKDGQYSPSASETDIFNSPWNIAAEFNVALSFDTTDITNMLNDFEGDFQTGMDIVTVAEEIFSYTSGYPFLVSKICKNINENLENDWTKGGVRRSVKLVLKSETPLFETLIKNITGNTELYKLMESIVMDGRKFPFNINNPLINISFRYGYIKEGKNGTEVSNRIFNTILSNYFTDAAIIKQGLSEPDVFIDALDIVANDSLNMERCLEKFSHYYAQYYSEKDERFIEREGRLLFLMFLSPILNGKGFAYIESQSADGKRTDVIVNYLNEQYIIELKIWDGQKKHEDAIEQLIGYMDRFQTSTGYLLTFNFNMNKAVKHEWKSVDMNRKILDVML